MSNLNDLKDACHESTLYDMDQRGFSAVTNYIEALEAENARLREGIQQTIEGIDLHLEKHAVTLAAFSARVDLKNTLNQPPMEQSQMCAWTRHGDTISTSCGESEEERREKWTHCPNCGQEIDDPPVGMTQGEWEARFIDSHSPGWYVVDGNGHYVAKVMSSRDRTDAHVIARLPEIIKAANRVRDQGIPSSRIPSVIHMLLDVIDAAKRGR